MSLDSSLDFFGENRRFPIGIFPRRYYHVVRITIELEAKARHHNQDLEIDKNGIGNEPLSLALG